MTIHYCPSCLRVYAIKSDSLTSVAKECRCPGDKHWVRDDDPEVIARHIGVPVEEWEVLGRKKTARSPRQESPSRPSPSHGI